MFLLALPLFLGTFLFAITILILFHNDSKRQGTRRKNKGPRITELPLITASGQIINTVEELDIHLEFLRTQTAEKEKELDISKAQLSVTEENLTRLTATTNEVKKYYNKLKSEVNRNENERMELHDQIEDCADRQVRLRDEVNKNVKYFSNLLENMDNSGENEDFVKEYEVIAPSVKIPPKKNLSYFTI